MLTLYATEHCHLCEQAAAMLKALDMQYTLIEIVDNEQLMARYGTAIPVLSDEQGEELHWPFCEVDIKRLTHPG